MAEYLVNDLPYFRPKRYMNKLTRAQIITNVKTEIKFSTENPTLKMTEAGFKEARSLPFDRCDNCSYADVFCDRQLYLKLRRISPNFTLSYNISNFGLMRALELYDTGIFCQCCYRITQPTAEHLMQIGKLNMSGNHEYIYFCSHDCMTQYVENSRNPSDDIFHLCFICGLGCSTTHSIHYFKDGTYCTLCPTLWAHEPCSQAVEEYFDNFYRVYITQWHFPTAMPLHMFFAFAIKTYGSIFFNSQLQHKQLCDRCKLSIDTAGNAYCFSANMEMPYHIFCSHNCRELFLDDSKRVRNCFICRRSAMSQNEYPILQMSFIIANVHISGNILLPACSSACAMACQSHFERWQRIFDDNILYEINDFNLTAKPIFSCNNCSEASAKLLRCSRCPHVYYCDKECQKEHWQAHKAICGSASRPPTSKLTKKISKNCANHIC